MFESQYLLWGRAGQDVLKRSTVAVLGCGRAGFEIATSAAIIGIGKVIVFDGQDAIEGTSHLDIPARHGLSRALQAIDAIRPLAPRSTLDAVVMRPGKALLSLVGPDIVIDASNDADYGAVGHAFCEKGRIPYLSLRSNRHTGVLDGMPSSCHEGSSQGYILSKLFAGVIIDACIDHLFKKSISAFSGLKEWEHGRLSALEDAIAARPQVSLPLSYDLCCRAGGGDCLNEERGCEGKSFLVVGGGSIGSHAVDILSRLRPYAVDVLDDDVFKPHNLNRQPLGYDGLGSPKARALAIKVGRISQGRVRSSALQGRAGMPKWGVDGSFFDDAWFSSQKYDAIIGCVDNNETRAFLDDMAKKNRLTYIDAGSSPTASRVSVYVPGKTSCVDCTALLKNSLAKEASPLVTAEGRLAVNAQGCTYQVGSIVTSNEVASALAVAETRCAVAGGTLVDEVRYSSRSRSRFSSRPSKGPCPCSANFKYE